MSKTKAPFQLVTQNNYQLDEVISSLQKEIRRGKEKQALYWALEATESGYGQYVWRRLMVISSEDVSITETDVPSQIWALFQMTAKDVKETSRRTWSDHEFMHLAKAVLLLCRSRKNRIVDYFLTDIKERRKRGWRLTPETYSVDIHTEKGKKLRKQAGIADNDYTDFYSDGVRLSNYEEIEGGQEYRNNILKHFKLDSLISDQHPKVEKPCQT